MNFKEIRIPRVINFTEKKLLIEVVVLMLNVFVNDILPGNKSKRLTWITDVTNYLETFKGKK